MPHRKREHVGPPVVAALEQRYLSLKQCAQYIGRTDPAVRHLVTKGLIPYRRLPGGRRIVFDREEIDQWIAGSVGVSVSEALRPVVTDGK